MHVKQTTVLEGSVRKRERIHVIPTSRIKEWFEDGEANGTLKTSSYSLVFRVTLISYCIKGIEDLELGARAAIQRSLVSLCTGVDWKMLIRTRIRGKQLVNPNLLWQEPRLQPTFQAPGMAVQS